MLHIYFLSKIAQIVRVYHDYHISNSYMCWLLELTEDSSIHQDLIFDIFISDCATKVVI